MVGKSKKDRQRERKLEELRNKEETVKNQDLLEKKRKPARQTPEKEEDVGAVDGDGHTRMTRQKASDVKNSKNPTTTTAASKPKKTPPKSGSRKSPRNKNAF